VKQIGRELGGRYVLEGSVQWACRPSVGVTGMAGGGDGNPADALGIGNQ
jgi:hypothetical protein